MKIILTAFLHFLSLSLHFISAVSISKPSLSSPDHSIYTYNKYLSEIHKNSSSNRFLQSPSLIHQSPSPLTHQSPSLVLRSVFSSQNVEAGSVVSLKCAASGNPLPQVTWTLDGSSLHESSSRISVGDFVTRSSEVISYVNISNIKLEDGGVYSCSAVNEVSENTHTARINVLGPPMVKSMSPKIGIESSSLVLNCPYSGYPIEQVFWEHSMLCCRFLLSFFFLFSFISFKEILSSVPSWDTRKEK